MQTVTVATFESLLPAEALRSRLEHVGIPSRTIDERKLQRFWFLVKPHAGIRVKVPQEHYQTSTDLVERWDAEDGALREAFRCPECRSSRIDYPAMTRNFVLPTLICHLFSVMGFFRHKAYCKRCHMTWDLARPESQRTRMPASTGPRTQSP